MPHSDSEPNTAGMTSSEWDSVSRTSLARKGALLRLMGKAHAVSILCTFASEPGPWRFNELKGRLELSPSTLSNRLQEMVDAELLVRRSYDEIPPRVEYEATTKARELTPLFEEFHDWVERHDHELH